MAETSGKNKQMQRYLAMVERLSPKSDMGKGMVRAYWVGGAICCLGQLLNDIGHVWLKLNNTAASCFASMALIFLTMLLTGLGIFDRIGQYAGAGSFVPITGFANAMVSPAMEFRREGLVMGVGAKLFTFAGPVLVYGVSASVIAGIITFFVEGMA